MPFVRFGNRRHQVGQMDVKVADRNGFTAAQVKAARHPRARAVPFLMIFQPQPFRSPFGWKQRSAGESLEVGGPETGNRLEIESERIAIRSVRVQAVLAPMCHGNTAGDFREKKTAEHVVHVRPEAVTPSLDKKKPAPAGHFPGSVQAAKAASHDVEKCTQIGGRILPESHSAQRS